MVNFHQFRVKTGFWLLSIGFLNMIIALVIAGVVQVYLQRLQGVSFMEVQNILLPFYGWRTIGGLITLAGGLIVAYDFIMLYYKRKPEE